MKIMIVDDEPDFVQILKMRLKKEGHGTIEAYDGEECLKKISKAPDIILLDVMMPNMTGIEVCEKIKDNPKTKDIPVIILSAKGEEKDVMKGMKAGATDYFPKPFSFDVLIAKIDSIIKTKKTEEDLEVSIRKVLDREINMLILHEQIKELESELLKVRSGDLEKEAAIKAPAKKPAPKKKAPAKKPKPAPKKKAPKTAKKSAKRPKVAKAGKKKK